MFSVFSPKQQVMTFIILKHDFQLKKDFRRKAAEVLDIIREESLK